MLSRAKCWPMVVLALVCIPTDITGFLTSSCVPHVTGHTRLNKIFNGRFALRGMGSPASGEGITNDAGEENLQAQFEKDLLVKNPEINQDQSKFARRAVVSAAAFGSLSQVLGSLAANAIDMQNAAGVGLNSMPKDKKPEPGSKAAQLSIFQARPLLIHF
jgi:hypothetical protein